ncbi:MAG: BolA family transcriptional regulator [Micavibrio aeruginosavorus]|uniref:BolA family transcriptional regulator n=1 Tax=Micavibrio aeruginosavorus TaxID=349221 RepID=A0A2W4ZMQ2_9BACT|nr:MAG: BolA family transcriptional regulator [Micavibrio aeruginosavorus]
MAMDAQTIADMIQAGIPGCTVRIDDLRGDGEHYAAHITAEIFRGMPRVAQHQMVYKALQGKMGGELHALAIHTSVPNNKE